jgi:hypothetical protein
LYGWYKFMGGDLEFRLPKSGGAPSWWTVSDLQALIKSKPISTLVSE